MIKVLIKFLLIYLFANTGFCDDKKSYIQLPDGAYFPAKPGETYYDTLNAAKKLYPKSFGLDRIPDNKKMDVTWFNNCRLNASKEAKTDVAVGQMTASCRELAVPQKCRVFEISKDTLGNESGAERVRCVEECDKASFYSKNYGECKRG